MPKGVKIALAVLLPVAVILGVVYGLAKIGVIPVGPLAKKSPIAATALKSIGLVKPKPGKAATGKPAGEEPRDTLDMERKAMQAALEKEKAEWMAQRERMRQADAQAQASARVAQPDPRSVARMASIYEQMPPEKVTKIFAKLPEPQVQALMRRMDEKQVAQILSLEPPERAARLTLALSRAAPQEQTVPN